MKIWYEAGKRACVVLFHTQVVFALLVESHSALIKRDVARLAVYTSIK